VALGLTWWQLALIVWGVVAIPAALLAYSLCRAAKDGDEVLDAQARSWAEAPAGDNWPHVEFTPEAKAQAQAAIDDHVNELLRVPLFRVPPSGVTPAPFGGPDAVDALAGWAMGLPVRTTPHVPRGTVMVMHPDQIEQIIAEFIHRRRPLVRRAPLRRVTRGWTPAGTYTGDPRVA
jgi:hypothetical protein